VLRWVKEGVGGMGVLSRENFKNFICQTVQFGEYLCNNWSTEWVHFVLLNTDVEAHFNQLSYSTAI